MARQLTSRERGLIAALVVATPVALWWFSGDESEVAVEAAAARRRRAEAREAAPVVELALLEAGATDYDPGGRDLFKYHVPPPPPQKYVPPPPPPPPPPRAVEAPPPRPIQGPRVEQPPAPTFRYIGFLGPKDGKFGTFEVGKDIVVHAAGEPIDKQFRLLEFRHDSVILGYEDARFKGRTTELKMRAK